MLINLHNLTHLPVITESGSKLGKVVDLNLDIEEHSVKSYIVRNNVFSKTLLIKPTQIVSITKEHIVVDDAMISVTEKKEEEKVKTAPAVSLARARK